MPPAPGSSNGPSASSSAAPTASPPQNAAAAANDASEKVSRRRISHISKACNGCRRRKMKCDAICKVYNEQCVYNPEQDGRRSAPKAYVSALEDRIRLLEGALRAHGINDELGPGPTGTAGGAGNSTAVKVKTERLDDDDLERRDRERESASVPLGAGVGGGGADRDRLKIDEETGELHDFGPFSVVKAVTDSSATQSSPSDQGVSTTGTGHERVALLVPRYPNLPTLGTPELDDWTHEEVLRLFFNYYNAQCYWVNERGFRRDLLASPTVEGTIIRPRRTPYYSPMLHNILLAMGVGFLNVDKKVREQLALAFGARAKALLEEETEQAMLSTVSGVLLLATFHASLSRHSLGFIYTGVGMRLIQALGMGSSCAAWVANGSISEETMQHRYNVFYASYILDKFWSTYVGRPASLKWADHDIPLPAPDAREDEVLFYPVVHPHSPQQQHQAQHSIAHIQSFEAFAAQHGAGTGTDGFLPRVSQQSLDLSQEITSQSSQARFQSHFTPPPTFGSPVKGWRSTTWHWLVKLCIIVERVIGTVYSSGFTTASPSVQRAISDIDIQLQKWHDGLPAPLRLPASTAATSYPPANDTPAIPNHILVMHSYYYFCIILVHRPWFAHIESASRDGPIDSSIEKCEKAAQGVNNILVLYNRSLGLRYAPITFSQVIFTTGTVHLLSAIHGKPRRRKAAFEAVQTCIVALEDLGDTWKCAAASAHALQQLLVESFQNQSKPSTNEPEPTEEEKKANELEEMLRDPAVNEHLKKLGWMPPNLDTSQQQPMQLFGPSPPQPFGARTMSDSPTNIAVSPVTVNWPLYQALQFQTSQPGLHPQAFPQAPPVGGPMGDNRQSQPNAGAEAPVPAQLEDGVNKNGSVQQQQQQQQNLVFQALYAGAPHQLFQTGNYWSWPFTPTDIHGSEEQRRSQ
ncbi:Nitrogen assimilation transcription factor nit-4 [Vanrija pseudolonga]|uniref:Nitrogen assimilation transcription factor nit-4 n=1 Tax=Vanrija pseudolonga TaxID=143232 RepID=A0AAF0YDP1_9TREE|nr:Nitrogen assimilation transcription factor nit-4 [Vanrija pseudolonga]